MRARPLLPCVIVLLPGLAIAHAGHAHAAGWLQGLLHPLTGLDHVLAMVAVAWWAVTTQSARWWRVPLAFAAATLGGAAVGAGIGAPVAGVEAIVAVSVLVFGMAMLVAWRASAGVAVGLATVLGAAHGLAHGVEPGGAAGAGAGAWIVGMAAGTLLLHCVGALAGRAALRLPAMTRAAGAAMAGAGALLLIAMGT